MKSIIVYAFIGLALGLAIISCEHTTSPSDEIIDSSILRNSQVRGGELSGEELFQQKKAFMKEWAFQAVVEDKVFCETCQLDKYVLKLKLEEAGEKVSWFNSKYMPYYAYNDGDLRLVVSKEVYEQAEIGHVVEKQTGVYSLKVDGQKFAFLSSKSKEWLQ